MTDPLTTPVLSRRQQKTRLILMNAFLHLLAERDLEQITVTDIANQANYGRWTFYQYFDSKEDIAWASFVYWMTRLDADLIAAVQHLTSPHREYQSWRIIFAAVNQQRAFFSRLDSLIQSRWYFRAREFLIQQFLGHMQAGHFALPPGIRAETAARLYVAALLELLTHWIQHAHSDSPVTLVNEFYTFIFNQPPPVSLP